MSRITFLTAIEGNRQRLDGGAMFGNAPRDMWKSWAAPDDRNRIDLACRSLLVRTDEGRTLLFEAGIGAFFDPKMQDRYGVSPAHHALLENLCRAGIREEEIDAVILSHLHFDHAGGLLSAFGDGEPRLLFPRAQYYVAESQWQRACHPHLRDRASFVPVLNELLERSGRIRIVPASGASDLAPLVKFTLSDGHTPGMLVSWIEAPNGPVVFAADLMPGAVWVNAAVSMGYDRHPELLIDEKQVVLAELARQGGYLFFTHDPQMPFARVRADAKGRMAAIPACASEVMEPADEPVTPEASARTV
ncbi:MAG TPA: MBL fold metallo-hydrolase [Candidatus Ozemobacteraceae bacterium]